jgi:hypothetical protein
MLECNRLEPLLVPSRCPNAAFRLPDSPCGHVGTAIYKPGGPQMHVGCLGRPLRPSRWTSHRTRWRPLLRASEVSVVLIAVLIAGSVGLEHLRRSPSDADTNGPSMGAVVGSPAADSTSPEGASRRSTEVDDHPRPNEIAPSSVVYRSAEPKPKHLLARLRSTAATHRQLLAARATRSNDNAHCGSHSPVRDSGCHQEGARRPPGVIPPS